MDFQNRQRRRLTGAFFVGNALASTAFLAAITVSSIAASELTGSTQLAGVPSALSTLGAALGASVLTSMSRRSGRRAAFCLGFSVSAAGGALAVGSLWQASFAVLLAAMLVMGFGRSVSLLSRFAAGDLWPDAQRASAIGFVVWAGTIGAVVGPLLIIPASRWGAAHLGTELAGPFALSGAVFVIATLWYCVLLRPEPMTLAVVSEPATAESRTESPRSSRELLRHPSTRLSFLVLGISQFVMILVMTMTPLHIRGHHHGLSMVGGVMMVHTLGMFAIAPLTGYLVDRLGARRVIAAGSVLLALSSLLSSVAGEAQAVPLYTALFLLGVGWNFGYVAASAALQEGWALDDRLRLQGLADSLTWGSGGLAALVSGFVMSAGSFSGLSLAAAVISLVPLWALSASERSRSDD